MWVPKSSSKLRAPPEPGMPLCTSGASGLVSGRAWVVIRLAMLGPTATTM